MNEHTKLTNEYLTIKDVQNYLNVSQSQVYALCHRKDFPVCRFGGAIRIPRDALLRWVELHTKMPVGLAPDAA